MTKAAAQNAARIINLSAQDKQNAPRRAKFTLQAVNLPARRSKIEQGASKPCAAPKFKLRLFDDKSKRRAVLLDFKHLKAPVSRVVRDRVYRLRAVAKHF